MNGRVAVIYYSASGNVHALAQAVADGAEAAGAEVRRRHVEELASQLVISQNPYRGTIARSSPTSRSRTPDHLEWADGLAFGTPTRFGNVAVQLKQFIDQAGRCWQEGKLADKVATTFTSSQTAHGGQETKILALKTTLYNWGIVARMLVPHLYFWKSAEWVRGLRLAATDEPGFWEVNGYHNYGDPWRGQRYRGD